MTVNPFWNVLPTLLWIAFLGALALFFRKDLKALMRAILGRVQHGATVRVAGLEIGSALTLPNQALKSEHSKTTRPDDGRRRDERDKYYLESRRIMLVHRLFPSTESGQLYDILIYVLPAKNGSLSAVDRVEYFIGGFGWDYKIFTARDRSHGFPVLTSAYGPFLCTAEVFFTDGGSQMLHRFIDFEMGSLAVSALERSSG